MGFIPPDELLKTSGNKSDNALNFNIDIYALGKVIYCCFTGNQVDLFPSLPNDIMADSGCAKLNKVVSIACQNNSIIKITSVQEFKKILLGKFSIYDKISNLLQRISKYFYLITFKSKIGSWVANNVLITIMSVISIFSISYYAIDKIRLKQKQAIEFAKAEAFRHDTEIADKLYGTINRRMSFGMSAGDQADGGVKSLNVIDSIKAHNQPLVLEGGPRQKHLTYKNDFSDIDLKIQAGNGITTCENNLRIPSGLGEIAFPQSLPDEYELSFKIMPNSFWGTINFEVIAAEYSQNIHRDYKGTSPGTKFKYYWSLKGDGDKMSLMPIMFRRQDADVDAFEMVGGPGEHLSSKNQYYSVKIIMTKDLMRIFINNEIYYYEPSLFGGGVFSIKYDISKAVVKIMDLQVYDIGPVKNGSLPAEQQYKLPSK